MSTLDLVAVWVGRAASEIALHECLNVSYSEDGDYEASQFERRMGIEHPDIGRREVTFHDPPVYNLEEMLKRKSYSDQIIPQFKSVDLSGFADGANAIVMLYEFDLDGNVSDFHPPLFRTPLVTLRFIGIASYFP
jgi:hypothetical protein